MKLIKLFARKLGAVWLNINQSYAVKSQMDQVHCIWGTKLWGNKYLDVKLLNYHFSYFSNRNSSRIAFQITMAHRLANNSGKYRYISMVSASYNAYSVPSQINSESTRIPGQNLTDSMINLSPRFLKTGFVQMNRTQSAFINILK